MAKYKIGDEVLVRTDLIVGNNYGSMTFLTDMAKLCGKVVTIKSVHGNQFYKVTGYASPFFTDEMFVGLAEEEAPKPTEFKVGDHVIASDNCGHYHEETGTIVELWPDMTHPTPYGVKFDGGEHASIRLWSKVHRLIEEEPKPTPTHIEVNVTVNLYENSCWYCRKGGLVDLYLAGAMGICPSCKRVCNATNALPKAHKPSKPSEPRKKENKPLTTEELNALPDGTKVFTVELKNGKEHLKSPYTCWRTVNQTLHHLDRKHGHYLIKNNGQTYHAYLEMPEGAVDSGE